MNHWQEASDKEKGNWAGLLVVLVVLGLVFAIVIGYVKYKRSQERKQFIYEHEQRN